MSKSYKTFTKQKWLFFGLSIVVFFVPLVVVIACVFPFMKKADTGYKVGLGVVVMLINCLPFAMGLVKWFFSHFPFFNWFAGAFLILGAFFNFGIFADYASKFLWVEGVAFVSGIIASVLWGLHRKYARYQQTVKAGIKSGAFQMKIQATNNPGGGSNATNGE